MKAPGGREASMACRNGLGGREASVACRNMLGGVEAAEVYITGLVAW